MAVPGGLSAQLGVGEEVTYGTPVTVTKFTEFLSEELVAEQENINSEGLRPGKLTQTSNRWTPGKISCGGSVELEVASNGHGVFFKHMLGAAAVEEVEEDEVYLHTFTPGALPPGLTVQVGRTANTGTTHAFTYTGCRVGSWELSASVDDLLNLSMDVLGREELTNVALATAVYPEGGGTFNFTKGSLTIDGIAAEVKELTVSGENSLDDERYFLGSRYRAQALENGLREYTGELSSEFKDLATYTKFKDGVEAALVVRFEGPVIVPGFPSYLEIEMNVRYDGTTPSVSGPELIQQNIPFTCIDDGTGAGSAITIRYQTGDATV